MHGALQEDTAMSRPVTSTENGMRISYFLVDCEKKDQLTRSVNPTYSHPGMPEPEVEELLTGSEVIVTSTEPSK